MMQTTVCDGCGKTEKLSSVPKNRDIQPVRFSILLEERESMAKNNETYESDLCSDCRKICVDRYFRIKEGSILEIPTFIEQSGSLRAV